MGEILETITDLEKARMEYLELSREKVDIEREIEKDETIIKESRLFKTRDELEKEITKLKSLGKTADDSEVREYERDIKLISKELKGVEERIKTKRVKLNKVIQRLNELEENGEIIQSVKKSENVNDEEYIYKVAKLTTNFLFRYICILKKKPTAIEKVFSELARNMNLDSMSKTLNEYAKDIEFRNILETIIVNPKAYSTYYLLTEYEKSLHSNEQWISPGRKKITVEHILPQKVDSKSNYGEKWLKEFANPEQCELYLNRLGNLTLLGPVGQANASNKSFDLKKQVYQKKTDMYMSRELIKYYEWNVKNIEERQKEMSRKIVNIFTLNINDI